MNATDRMFEPDGLNLRWRITGILVVLAAIVGPVAEAREPAVPGRVVSATGSSRQAKYSDKTIAELIAKLCPPGFRGYKDLDKLDQTVIAEPAGRGADAIEPLLTEGKKSSNSFRPVCIVLAKMKPSVLPTLVKAYRPDFEMRTRSVISSVIREQGARCEAAVIEMFKDSDAEIRSAAASGLIRISGLNGDSMSKSMERSVFGLLEDSDPKVQPYGPLLVERLYGHRDGVLAMLIDLMKKNTGKPLGHATFFALTKVYRGQNAKAENMRILADAFAWTLQNEQRIESRRSAARCLVYMKSQAKSVVAALRKTTDDKDPAIRTFAQKALYKNGDTLAVALRQTRVDPKVAGLILQFAGSDYYKARLAETELVKLGHRNFDLLMVAAGADLEFRYCRYVARIIGRWDRKVVDQLVKRTGDKNYRIRCTAAMAWGHMASVEKLPKSLLTLLGAENGAVRGAAGLALVRLAQRPSPSLRNAAVARVIGLLSSDKVAYIDSLYLHVEKLAPQNPEIIAAMIKVLKTSPSRMLRTYAIWSLGSIGQKLAPDRKELPVMASALHPLVQTGDSAMRQFAISALGKIGPPAKFTLPSLNKASDSPIEPVARLAREAIVKIKAAR